MHSFSRNLWVYLVSGFFWSLGLMTFFLVYNLHLLELGFDEAIVGKVASVFTSGSLAMTLLTGRLLSRYGENCVIQSCVLATAVLLPFRSLTPSPQWLLIASFLNGASIAGWMISAPPFLARNTRPEGRAWAFSVSYASSIGTGALAGLAVAFVSLDWPLWVWIQERTGFSLHQCMLFASAVSVLLAFLGLLFLRDHKAALTDTAQSARRCAGISAAPIENRRRFALQLLTALVLWSFFVGSFPPFFNVYFHKQYNQPLSSIGVIFSISQLCQCSAVLCMPWLIARLGRVRAIAFAQCASALALPALAVAGSVQRAGLIYLSYLTFQVMVEPALESFIMDSVRPEERNRAASIRYMALFSTQAVAVLVSGFAITHLGYSWLLAALALLGIAASWAFYVFFHSRSLVLVTQESGTPAACPLH
jgi:MFS family permease